MHISFNSKIQNIIMMLCSLMSFMYPQTYISVSILQSRAVCLKYGQHCTKTEGSEKVKLMGHLCTSHLYLHLTGHDHAVFEVNICFFFLSKRLSCDTAGYHNLGKCNCLLMKKSVCVCFFLNNPTMRLIQKKKKKKFCLTYNVHSSALSCTWKMLWPVWSWPTITECCLCISSHCRVKVARWIT